MKNSMYVQINVVPLVDILLVLIVITLLTANFLVQSSVKVNSPQSESKDILPKDKVELEVNAEGKVFFLGKELEVKEIPVVLFGISPQSPVVINADRDSKLQIFISVLDEVKKAGFSSVSIRTLQP